MKRSLTMSRRDGERGVVIVLVAIVMLFVIGAMAVLAIDLVTFYTARSEAQLAADSAALAGARVLANSGMTSDPTNASLMIGSELLARNVAGQVAVSNKVGGRNLNSSEVTIFSPALGLQGDPRITVQVKRTDIPTFFARIWGNTQITISASSTAEAYNPSGLTTSFSIGPPVAPLCVKPWLLPNMDPTTAAGAPIFDPTTGQIMNPGLIGQTWPNPPLPGNINGLSPVCGSCTALPAPSPGQYYPGAIDVLNFPAPTHSLPTGSAGFNPYQLAVAGCVPRPIACGQNATINIDTNPYATNRDADTIQAVKVAIHDNGAVGDSDSIDPAWVSGQPFQFIGGNANPVAGAISQNIVVSDSLATIPVIDSTSITSSTVTVIGFLQVFLNPQGNTIGAQIPATIINMSGCGTAAIGQPIVGNGGSPVTVRLVH